MHALLEELLQILEQELASYRCLHEMMQEARALIIACRAEELAEQTALQEQLQAALRDLDRTRAARVAALGARLGLPSEEHTTSALAAHLPEPYAGRMRALSAEMGALLARIHRVNDDNRFHLFNACAFLEASLRIIAAARAPRNAGLYGRRGMVTQGGGRQAATVSVNRQA